MSDHVHVEQMIMSVDKYTALSVEVVYSTQTSSGKILDRPSVLLFVHGLGSNKAIWTESAEMLSTYGYTCILVDLRGHGKSADAVPTVDTHEVLEGNQHQFRMNAGDSLISDDRNDRSFSLAQSADDLAVVLKTFRELPDKWNPQANDYEHKIENSSSRSVSESFIGPRDENNMDHKNAYVNKVPNISDLVAVIGHSYGGNVAVEFSVRHPSLLSSLFLVDGGYIDLQGTFPDFNSCLLALRPPSFVGVSADDLENIVRTVWAVEEHSVATFRDHSRATVEEDAKHVVGESVRHRKESAGGIEGGVEGGLDGSDTVDVKDIKITENLNDIGAVGAVGAVGIAGAVVVEHVAKRFDDKNNRENREDREDSDDSEGRGGSDGRWSEVGIQAMLKNFRTVYFAPNTTTASVRARTYDAEKGRGELGRSCGNDRSNSSSNSSSSSSSSNNNSGGSISGRLVSDSSISSRTTAFTVSTTQTVLSFHRYMLLLEDLWRRRPVNQFRELHALRVSDKAAESLSGTSGSYSIANANVSDELASVFHSREISVIFLPSGSSSPFSKDKEIDIKLAIDATRSNEFDCSKSSKNDLNLSLMKNYQDENWDNQNEVVIEKYEGNEKNQREKKEGGKEYEIGNKEEKRLFNISTVVRPFPTAGHNIPLQMPRELSRTIHSYLGPR